MKPKLGFAACLLLLGFRTMPMPGQLPLPPAPRLGKGPWTFETVNVVGFDRFEPGPRIKVSVVTDALVRPYGLAFLPDGTILITEMEGRLRTVRNGALDPEPIAGVPRIRLGGLSGLMDVAVHPDFAANGLVYLTYMKGGTPPDGGDSYYATTALARAKLDGKRLTDIKDIYVADAWTRRSGGSGSRVAFGADRKLFVTSSWRGLGDATQKLDNDFGKILRLNDDGSVPGDNPFVAADSASRAVYSLGHRTIMGLTIHPRTGEVWAAEAGPLGGDEVNLIRRGLNYGWPVVSYGRDYDGSQVGQPWKEGMEQPVLHWTPSITTTNLMFYNADKFPTWKGSLFIGSLRTGRLPGTGHLQRVFFNEKGEQGREMLLTELRQRIRDVSEGPDGLVYVLTDEGALLKIEPAAISPDATGGH
jgi:glucose/arabinose dehydrogenase